MARDFNRRAMPEESNAIAPRTLPLLTGIHPVPHVVEQVLWQRPGHVFYKLARCAVLQDRDQGPEHHWPRCVSAFSRGFDFPPDKEHYFRMEISDGSFVWEPEWRYMVYRPKDAQRGQDPDSDLFSPGYLSAFVEGNQTVSLWAAVGSGNEISLPQSPTVNSTFWPFSRLLYPSD